MYVILKATNVCEDIACCESSADNYFSKTLAKLFCGILTCKKTLVLVSFHKYVIFILLLCLFCLPVIIGLRLPQRCKILLEPNIAGVKFRNFTNVNLSFFLGSRESKFANGDQGNSTRINFANHQSQ